MLLACASACSGAMYAGVPSIAPSGYRRRLVASLNLAIPESSHLHRTVAGEKQVRWLQVAVHDPLGVRGDQHVEELVGGQARAQWPAPGACRASPRPRRATPLRAFHDEERRPVLCDVVVVHDGDRAGCFTELATYPSRRKRVRMFSRMDSSGWSILMANSF